MHVKEVIAAFVRKHHNVTLVIRGKIMPEFFKKHMFTFRLPDFRFPRSIPLYLISTLITVIEALFRKPVAIYIRDNGLNVGVIIGKIFRVPVLLEINGDLLLEYPFQRGISASFFRLAMKNSYSLANAIVIPSKGQLSILQSQEVNRKNVYVIPNGVNHYKFSPQSKLACRQKLNLEKECFYFCFVGNLASWQGLDNAVIALSLLLREIRNHDIKLVIVGDGTEKKQLENLSCELNLKDRIIFLGVVPHESVPYIINACDVCIAPFTAWRNKKIGVSPLKLYEYLSCGKPVIASSLLGTEIIEELDAGILVEPDNVEDLKNAFGKAIKMLPYWEKKAHILHEEIVKNHSWNSRVDNIIEIIYRIHPEHGL